MTTERLISADDHVDVSHDLVKQHLATKFHDDYDAGLLRFRSSMASTASVAANEQWRTQQGLAPDPERGHGQEPAARGQRSPRSLRRRRPPRRHGRPTASTRR